MKIILSFVTLVCLISCVSSNKITDERCKSAVKNGFKRIVEGTHYTIINNDSISLNEIIYECTFTSFYTKKVMFDKFGEWDNVFYTNYDDHPILVWNNIKLFNDQKTTYTIVTNGDESKQSIYASVMVFDQHNNDLLSPESKEKTRLVEYFSNLIHNNDSTKTSFYDKYWKVVR